MCTLLLALFFLVAAAVSYSPYSPTTPDYTPTKRVFQEQSKDQLSRFIGKYDFPDIGQIDMIVKDDGLEFTGASFSDPIFLWPESDSTFFNKNSGTRYNFTLKNNLVTDLQFSRYQGKKAE